MYSSQTMQSYKVLYQDPWLIKSYLTNKVKYFNYNQYYIYKKKYLKNVNN